MSAWLGIDLPEGTTCYVLGECSWCRHDANMTSNLLPMLRAAGYPGHQLMKGAPVSEAAGILGDVLHRLEADPDTYRALEPANGWGDYVGAVETIRWWVIGAQHHPAGRLYVND